MVKIDWDSFSDDETLESDDEVLEDEEELIEICSEGDDEELEEKEEFIEIGNEDIEIEKAHRESIMQGVEMIQAKVEKELKVIEYRKVQKEIREMNEVQKKMKEKEKENKAKWELVEKLEEDIIETRDIMEVVLRQADACVKSTGEESRIEEIRKNVKHNSEFWEAYMSKKIKDAKETGI